ncbi:UDP-galactopyranose mutase [Cellulophaga algicola DSM 14237]|uniref:UDP-galactopyranose mutase n=1 Tax=Cellulophaga algicola (strain DSM 14237 / IC166 / ACAM 630) TaxID=688270 RepID=E6X8E3_CELAD|nr:NAD(P)/FAD-dependent oxidoreductase [Cellulophaga algicola]ADV50799.1 UDP-galactopyranose mutase [Cellulophaga algicola DSM 14237]
MAQQEHKIHIIGAGISGLIAAQVLEQNGFSPVIIEATGSIGGRIKTDIVQGYQLDHGFQVLLTAYPAAQKYLDFKALDLQKFLPGAAIFKNGQQLVIGDPIRNISLLFPTLLSGIGLFSDKLLILKLNRLLKQKSVLEIFSEKEQTTLSYLKEFGFSNEMITDFFSPFFSGIFLENKLTTSSRMFNFIYKMFGEGYAALPKSGIAAIPKQLSEKLIRTTIQFNTKVSAVKDKQIDLADGTELASDFIIVATEASHLISRLKNQKTEWKSCYTLYFEVEKRTIRTPLIGLVPNKESVVNNIFYHTSLNTATTATKELLSVTVIDHKNLSEEALIKRVQIELKEQCAIEGTRFIKLYHIPTALPNLDHLRYEMSPSETRLTSGIFLAGDTQLNGSLNAAIISGERAALAVIETISGTVLS